MPGKSRHAGRLRSKSRHRSAYSSYGYAVDLDAQMQAVLRDLPNLLLAELGQERASELAENEPEKLNELVRGVV